MRRVVVTGLGALSPIGHTVEENWLNLKNGKSGAGPITKFDATKFKTQFACEIKDLDLSKHFTRKEIRMYDPFTLYALIATEEAINDSKLDLENSNRNRIGVIWGSGNGGIQTFQDQLEDFCEQDKNPKFSPYFMPRTLVDIAAGVISIKYGLHGPNFAPISACATSTTAIIEAYNHIKWDKADVFIAGGSDAPITPAAIGGFNSLKALSTSNETPFTASKPLDKDRNGFVMGEGAGALVIEEYEHAVQRGATIYAEIVGGGMAADAYHLTGTHPEGKGAILGMNEAMREAQINPSDIDLINLHATSTPIGDESEITAIQSVFKDSKKKIYLNATKSNTGHLLGAAGAIESIFSILALKNQFVPGTINTKKLDFPLKENLRLLLGEGISDRLNYAMNNNFGFGGHTATVIFKNPN